MMNLGEYEALRNAGATPREVCQTALQRTGDLMQTVLVLRGVFKLSRNDAKTVLREVITPPEDDDPLFCFRMMIIDPNTRAPVGPPLDVELSPKAVRAALARPATVCRRNWLAWGSVTRTEIEALIAAGGLASMHRDDVEAHPPERWIWSLNGSD